MVVLGGEECPVRLPPATARTIPALLELFNWITVTAPMLPPRRPAWYPKIASTFADALPPVRVTLGTGASPFAQSCPPAWPNRRRGPPPLGFPLPYRLRATKAGR